MSTKRRYPKEEIFQRGEAIFEKDVKAHVKGRDPMDFVVIDIEMGDYEVDADNLTACSVCANEFPMRKSLRDGSDLVRFTTLGAV